MHKRHHIKQLKKRLEEPRLFIQVITGPRQVGKTTLANQLLKGVAVPWAFESADAVPAGTPQWIEQLWEGVRLKMRTNKLNEYILAIDEIQKITGWSEMVKRLWDEDTRNGVNIKVLILGSSRLMLQQGLTESLAGRFELTYMSHWSFSEMRESFGWDACTYAWYGGYPGSAAIISDEDRWKRYIIDSLIETSIAKDILMLTRIDKPALLRKLFELGCSYSGQILSYTKIQGQLQDAGNTTTLSHYLNLLDTAGLLGGIEKYAADVIRKRASSPKFQVHNNALLSAQSGLHFSEIRGNPKGWGRVIESAIGSHLVNQSISNNYKVYYWRDRGNEVDFVLERQNKIVAIEVKSTTSQPPKGMEVFVRSFKPQRVYLIDNKNLHWEEVLAINPSDLF
ncbi:MAG: ATP-binding protein [Bacteroidales bacterium]|jgi:hypothetical protein|nr:ATP-binding protein [Bacteroidales bacterium]